MKHFFFFCIFSFVLIVSCQEQKETDGIDDAFKQELRNQGYGIEKEGDSIPLDAAIAIFDSLEIEKISDTFEMTEDTDPEGFFNFIGEHTEMDTSTIEIK